MRSVSAANLAIAQSVDGHESLILLEIDTGAGKLLFSDRELPGCDDRIMEFANLNMQVAEGSPATAGSVTVKLSDEDLYLLGLIGTTRLEGRVARILQIFDGNVDDPIELMVGRVGSPVVWSEESRTFEFDVVSFYESSSDTEVPFAPDENSGLQEFAWDKTWPRVYGTPVDVPAVLVIDAPSGTLIRELQPTFDHFEIEVADGVEFPLGSEVTVEVGNEYITGTFSLVSDDPTVILRFDIAARNESKGVIFSLNRATLSTIEDDPNNGGSWEADPRYAAWDSQGLVLAGNWLCLLDTSSQLSSGIFSDLTLPGSGLYGDFRVPSFVGNKNYILYQKGDATRGQFPWIVPSGLYYIGIGAKADVRGVLDVSDTLWPAGTSVRLVTDVVYVANDLQSDAVLQVRAWREVQLDSRGGRRRELVVLPADFYDVDLADTIAGRVCTTLTLDKPLSARGTGWQDELFVTLKNGDGNVSDIVADLVEEAGLTVDPTSFALVLTATAKYPMNFYFVDRKDALAAAADIAFQGRCALSVLGSLSYLKYLSASPTSVGFVYDNDQTTLEGTVQISSTETTSLVNDLAVTWRKRGSQQHLERLHLKSDESVAAFGRKKKDLDIWVYRHKRLVAKTAQFWFNRWSNVWRKLRLTGDLDAIAMTVYDDVKSILPELVTNAVIEQLEHDTAEDQITALLWTPIVVGTTSASSLAYLDDNADVVPAELDLSEGDDVAEVIEVSPLDFTLTEKQTHVGEVTQSETPAGPIGGIFKAKLFKSNFASGDVFETEVTVQNISNTPMIEGDVVVVHRAEDGTFYSTKGGSSSSVNVRGGVLYAEIIADEDGAPVGFDNVPTGNEAAFNTPLTVDEESAFQAWKLINAPSDSGIDYDYRGAFKAGILPAESGHWPDTFKKPNHPTFSEESKYAYLMPHLAGYWTGNLHDQYNDPDRNPDHYCTATLYNISAGQQKNFFDIRFCRKLTDDGVFNEQKLPAYIAPDGTVWVLPINNPFGMALVKSNAADKNNISCRLYKTTDFDGLGDEDIIVKTPRLNSTTKISAGTWLVVMRIADSWIGYLPLIRPRVPA